MEFRQLGNSDLRVSSIGLGSVTFGREIDAETSFSIIDYAMDRKYQPDRHGRSLFRRHIGDSSGAMALPQQQPAESGIGDQNRAASGPGTGLAGR